MKKEKSNRESDYHRWTTVQQKELSLGILHQLSKLVKRFGVPVRLLHMTRESNAHELAHAVIGGVNITSPHSAWTEYMVNWGTAISLHSLAWHLRST